MKHLIPVTAGHIDYGKSSLVIKLSMSGDSLGPSHAKNYHSLNKLLRHYAI
jgi:translation elongation factor EF-Tu-like GTPase